MRADRLLSLLMLLQERGGLTARELSQELEVSERTIYRDLTALSMAGIPVYAQRGPGGGWHLVENYRTDLTGLSPDEARALFMLAIPAPLDQLGVGGQLKTAMRKLAAALPASRRGDPDHTRQRFLLDPTPWGGTRAPLPHLAAIQEALWQDRKLYLRLRGAFYSQSERVVDPYGLVAKEDAWRLVAARADHIQVVRVADILAAEVLEETFERPTDFDLGEFWKDWCAAYEAQRPQFKVTVCVSPALASHLQQIFRQEARQFEIIKAARELDGWIKFNITFDSLFEARSRLLAYGGAIEVLEPTALRLSIADFARQTLIRYQG